MGSEQVIVADQGPVRHLLTVEDFLILDEAGAFEQVGRVELIEGEVFVMAPLHRPHARALMILSTAIDLAVEALGGSLEAMSPVSAQLGPHSLPEADVVIADAADEAFVTPATVRILVEVAASSLAHDLGRKLALYARAGVPEYWVADVAGRRVIRLHVPQDDGYAERVEFTFGSPVPSATIAGLVVDTARLA